MMNDAGMTNQAGEHSGADRAMICTLLRLQTAALLLVLVIACTLSIVRAAAQAEERTDAYGDKLPRFAIARLGRASPTPNTEEGHTLGIYNLAFSPDNKTVVTRGGDGTVRAWDSHSGKQLARLEASKPLAFSSDGGLLITGGTDTGLRLWNTATWKDPREIECKTPEMAVFLPEDKSLLVLDGEVPQVIALQNGNVVHTYAGWRFWIVLHLAADGEHVAVGHSLSDPTLAFGELTRSQTQALKGNREFPRSVTFSVDCRMLAAGERGGDIHLWRFLTGHESTPLRGHSGAVQGLAFSPDGWFLASASSDKTVRLWETATGKEVAVLTGHQQYVAAVGFSPDGNRLVSGSIDRTALVWDVLAATIGTADPNTPLDEKELTAQWEALADTSARGAYQALALLAAHPEKSLEFLQQQFDSSLRLSQKEQVEQWIKDLDSPQYMVRERATQALIAARDVAQPLLLETLKTTLSAEVRHRLRRILAFQDKPTVILSDELRLRRTIRLLQRIGGDRAKEMLRGLVKQSLSPLVVQDAKRALAALSC